MEVLQALKKKEVLKALRSKLTPYKTASFETQFLRIPNSMIRSFE